MNWDPDCIEHPDNYNKYHIQYVPYENTIHDNTRPAEINDFDIGQLSESDTLSIPGSTNTIPLHSVVSTTQEISISNVNDEDEV